MTVQSEPSEAMKLKPCPLCGNDGSGPIEDALHVSHIEDDQHFAYDRYTVQCDKCTVTMGYSDSEDEAIAAWNTRALDPARATRTDSPQTEPSEAPLSNRLREAFPKNEAFGPVTAYLRGMIHEAADRIDALELATRTDSRPDCSRCGKPIIMTASECDGCARTDSPTDAVLRSELWAVHEALGHLENFEVREPDLHLTRDNCRAILRDVAKALAALPPVTDSPTDAVEAKAREIAKRHGLDPDAISPKAAKAGHSIPEWYFFGPQAIAELAALPPSGEVERMALRSIAGLSDPLTKADASYARSAATAALRNSTDGETM